jgi:hypothetical protein
VIQETSPVPFVAASAALLLTAAATAEEVPQLQLQGVALGMDRAAAAEAATAAGGRCNEVGAAESLAPLLCGFGADRLRVAFVPGGAGRALVGNVALDARGTPPLQIDVDRVRPRLIATYGDPTTLRQTRQGFEACWTQPSAQLRAEVKPRLLLLRLSRRNYERPNESTCR